jgi:hypothetical protein
MADDRGRKLRAWLLLLPAIIIVGLIVGSSLFRHGPPGTEIVNRPVPEKHPTGPCFECHSGMAAAAEIADRPVPEPHPQDKCADCHKGYVAPATAPAASGSTP